MCTGAPVAVDAFVHLTMDAEYFIRALAISLSGLKKSSSFSARGRYKMSPLLWKYIKNVFTKYICLSSDTTL